MKKKASQRGSLRLTSDKAERLRAFREGPADDSSRRPRTEPAHVVLARAQAAEAERLRRARAPKPPKPEQALAQLLTAHQDARSSSKLRLSEN